MTQTFSIRPATAADLDALTALNAQVQALHASFAPERFPAEADGAAVRGFFAERLALDGNHIWLACAETAPIAYIWLELEDRAATPFTRTLRRVHIHHVGVDAAWRRRGVAGALFAQADASAKANVCAEVTLDVWAANAAARAFFAATGFSPRRIVMAKGA